MDGIGSTISLAGGLLAILGVLVALTRYLTQLQEHGKVEKAVAESRETASRLEAAERERDQLRGHLTMADKVGEEILRRKLDLDTSLGKLMTKTGASAGSIYVPVENPSGDEVHGLAFLCIEPFSPDNQQLRRTIVPMHSIAGRCFEDGKSFVDTDTPRQENHFKEAERISNYQPGTTLNVALKSGGATVGVLQLLSREGEAPLTDADLRSVQRDSPRIAAQIEDLAKNIDLNKVLDLGHDAEGTEGSVIFFDLSGSSLLFEQFSASFALNLMNEYFETVCEAAFRAGATLDNYMGDGALLRFNISKPEPEHELAAVKAALEMKSAFSEVSRKWTRLRPGLANLHNRVGISSGTLFHGNLGHSQFQRLTIVGYPIAVAAALCNLADRKRSVILASEETYEAVKDHVVGVEVEVTLPKKVKRFTAKGFEISGMR